MVEERCRDRGCSGEPHGPRARVGPRQFSEHYEEQRDFQVMELNEQVVVMKMMDRGC